jgi:hypothetical protein
MNPAGPHFRTGQRTALRIERRQKTLLPRLLTLCVWISAVCRELLGGGETHIRDDNFKN